MKWTIVSGLIRVVTLWLTVVVLLHATIITTIVR